MKLLILSDYGEKEYLKMEDPSESDIIASVNSIDWNLFHQVCLSKDDQNWIEVGGNVNNDGLSAMYEKSGEQFVINIAPASISQLIEILLSYYKSEGQFNTKYKFTKESNNSDTEYDATKVYYQLLENHRKESFDKNKSEKYGIVELIELFIFAPYYFVRSSHRFESFKHLLDENKTLMLKQKTIIYVLSFISWYLFIKYQILNY